MRLHVQLAVVLLAVHARAATIPSSNPQKALQAPTETADKETPLDNITSEQELIDSANTIKDVENNLRVKAADIPVKVVVEETKVDDSTPDLKRVEVDLNNPGEPQRQEHETQNAVHYEDGHEQQFVTSVKQTVLDTEANLKQGIQGVAQGIQNWIANNEQLTAIQQSIQGLQQSFTNQINRLNDTIQSFWTNQNSANTAQSNPPQNLSPQQIESVENHLKTLENNFQTGVKALSEGVQVFATLKQSNPSTPIPPNNLFSQYLQMFQQSITQGFSNVTQAFQTFVGQTANATTSGGILQGLNTGIQSILNPGQATTAAVQSDEPTTSRPSLWQGIQSSIQNILNPGQSQSGETGQGTTATPNRPIAQAIQNLPFVQGVVNFIQPARPEALPALVKPSDTEPTAPEGTNVVPSPEKSPDVATDTKPSETAQPAKATGEQVDEVPVKNIIQDNPIVNGITGAVQKLQSLSNPEKPRDAVSEQAKEAAVDPKGHGSGGSGDNNDNSSGVETIKELKEVVKTEDVTPVDPKIEVVEQKKEEIEKTEKS